MLLNMTYNIQIGTHHVKHLLSVDISTSVSAIADTAMITLPATAYGKPVDVEKKYNIRRGDVVSISIGYNDDNRREFTGYVRSITNDNSLKVECEDRMYLLRKSIPSIQYKNISVAQLIRTATGEIGEFEYNISPLLEQAKYSKYTVDHATAYEVLQNIQKDMGIHIFVKDKTLHAHGRYEYKNQDVRYDMATNVERSSLKYLQKVDRKVEIVAISISTKDNSRIEVKAGQSGGDRYTEHVINKDKNYLEAYAESKLQEYTYDGYSGSISTWLIPRVSIGDTAELYDADYPYRKGGYYVEAIKTTFDHRGGRRRVQIGKQVRV